MTSGLLPFMSNGAASATEDEVANERWLPLADWPRFEVSSLGQVRTFYVKHGSEMRLGEKPIIKKSHMTKDGHCQVVLRHLGKPQACYVHSLVLKTFVGDRPAGMQACHNNGNPADNRLTNLRWDTPSNNQIDSVYHGRSTAKLTPRQIPVIWRRLVAGDIPSRIAPKYKVTTAAIYSIKIGQSWGHITRKLPGWPLAWKTDKFEADSEPVFAPKEVREFPLEAWMPVPDWPAYRVSSHGRVISCWKIHRRSGEHGGLDRYMSDEWRTIKAARHPRGYLTVGLCREDDKRQARVHTLVLEAFAGPCPPNFVSCHCDGNPANNHISTLRWDSQRANVQEYFDKQKGRACTETA